MNFFETQMQRARDWFERLTERERRVLGGGGAIAVIFLVVLFGGYVTNSLSTFSENNANMRKALKDIESKRDSYLKSKAKLAYYEGRLGGTPVKLAGYIEQAAKDSGIGDIPDQKDARAPCRRVTIIPSVRSS